MYKRQICSSLKVAHHHLCYRMGYHSSLSTAVAAVAAVAAFAAPDAVATAAGALSAFDLEERTNSILVEQADI